MATAATVHSFQQLIEQIRGEPLGVAVQRETRFVEDLGMASLELITLVYLCEHTFAVSLLNLAGLVQSLRTVGQSIDAITGLQQGVDVQPTAAAAPGAG